MNSFKRTSLKLATGTAITGAVIAGAFVAAPAQAAEPAPSSSMADVGGSVNVNLDPVAIVNAIADAVNDQSDRGGAVQAALDVGYRNAGNPDRLTVAVVNKNQDITVEGDVADAQSIDIKGGNYVIYWFKGAGKITNNGDGGWLNWGAFGNIERIDNVIHVNGG
ncbi:hypothetical protein JOE58_001837 [Curtobacterium luteum]|uniref:Stress protein n=1 Tax=Curtobacterium luteum TaxID=33881 RepID=A0A7Y6BA79_9MICO|nr:hypothetical protein [Curtobacterium luteum]MBM7802586.1 hypothetical protein [Curtobacterium luteum]NUU50289.1 hypothetical protein [Curtobacterium luteum]NUU50394.1 hypothetical protein [Curtobacterium luteum]GGL06688.1 hypothetical protein GCM10009769_26270 [Curtobacterium luteum]